MKQHQTSDIAKAAERQYIGRKCTINQNVNPVGMKQHQTSEIAKPQSGETSVENVRSTGT
ncbi:hypothetical protein [Dyadobacter sp.]|uniref:hypothetical protein n=1 Tax=Dyadobacter sp. TaxID=1914288 RepID=UPI003F72A873